MSSNGSPITPVSQRETPEPSGHGPSSLRLASLHTLGCRLNQAETAKLAAQLQGRGYQVVPWGDDADLLIVNSCTVTGTAASKTRQALRVARRRCPDAFIVLTGCEAALATPDALAALGVNLIVPNERKAELADLLPESLTPEQHIGFVTANPSSPDPAADASLFTEADAALPTARTRANLKVQEGCNVGCHYCIIPRVRGRPRSRAWDDALREVRELAAGGVREIVVTGVNLALYNDHGRRLPDLLEAIFAAGDGFRIRVSSFEPGPDLNRLLELMQRSPRLCRHLHVPIQYGEDSLLQAMGRRYRASEFAEFATRAVQAIPGLCLGIDVIVGFPGESETAFGECRRLLAALPLAYFHVFPYSARPGTKATTFPGRVHGNVVRQRAQELAKLGREKAAEFAKKQVGQCLTVLTESRLANGNWQGLSDNYLELEIADAPADLGQNCLVRVEAVEVRQERQVLARYRGPVEFPALRQ